MPSSNKPRPLPAQMTVPLFMARKNKTPLVMVTAYDAPQGRLADASGADALLVGDSVGMTTLGYDSTLPVTLEDILHHCRAVARGQAAKPFAEPTPGDMARGARRALLVADMPFGSYGHDAAEGVRAGMRLLAEGNAHAVKLEGAGEITRETVRRLVDVGVPVMGHLGLTPQSIHKFGGFKAQGKSDEAADALLEAAQNLVSDGVFGIVLEVIPASVAARITAAIPVPTIGIGAGAHCDGQVQVLHDLLGLTGGPVLRHAKRYTDGDAQFEQALSDYAADVRAKRFPTDENSL